MLLLLTLSLLTAHPDTLSLSQAQTEAVAAHPLRDQIAAWSSIESLRSQNIAVRYLPSVTISGQAVYHSDVAEIQLPGSAIPSPANDQYKIALGLDQLVYDGGVTAQLKELERIQRDLEQGNVEVEIYALRQQVNSAFFGALIFESQIATLKTLADDLSARLASIRSLVRNGVLLRSNADVLEAELINVGQQMAEARANRRTALDVLGELMGRPLKDGTLLSLPDVTVPPGIADARLRPEYRVFDLSKSALDSQARMITRRNRPLVSAFAEGAFGRPAGLNLFETDFKPFYTAGLRITWRAWQWRVPTRERQTLQHQREIIDARERAFRKNTTATGFRQLNDITKLEQLIESDEEAIRLRRRIVEEAGSRLENGTITSTEYVTEKNAENRAQLLRQIHRIQLAQARAEYLTIMGQL